MSRIKNFIEHLEKNKENELVKKVINNETSFVKEIENFYDVYLSYGFKEDDSRKWKKSNKTKYGQSPEQLLFMLDPFTEEGKLNPEYLTYEKFRKQVKKAEISHLAIFLGVFGGCVGFITATVGAITTSLEGFHDMKPALPIGLGILGVSIYGLIKNAKYFNKETLEGNEFFKLKNVANYVADPFIEKYRIYKELQEKK